MGIMKRKKGKMKKMKIEKRRINQTPMERESHSNDTFFNYDYKATSDAVSACPLSDDESFFLSLRFRFHFLFTVDWMLECEGVISVQFSLSIWVI